MAGLDLVPSSDSVSRLSLLHLSCSGWEGASKGERGEGRLCGRGQSWDLGHRWRAETSRHDPRSSEPVRKEEHLAKFLEQTFVRLPWEPALLWGGVGLWKVVQHLPQHPAHPSGLFLLQQENDFSRLSSGRRETRAKDSWEEIWAQGKQRELVQGLELQWRAHRSGSETLGPWASRGALWTGSLWQGKGTSVKWGQ